MNLRSALETAWLILSLPLLAATVLLIVSAATLEGHLTGMALLLLWLPIPFLAAGNEPPKGFRVSARVAIAFGVLLLIKVILNSPTSSSTASSAPGFHSEFAGETKFRRLSPSNLVPEIDQLLMGSRLFTLLDPHLTANQAREVRKSLQDVYRGLRQDAEFREAPGVLGEAYREILLGTVHPGHRYVYLPSRPSSLTAPRYPVLIFLHGSLGNFKGYLWTLKLLADELGIAIVAPTLGAGEWRNSEGRRAILETLDYCHSRPDFDSERMILAGISNGGAGVTRLLASLEADSISGLVYLSPVIDPETITGDRIRGFSDKPVLIISGTSDRRVPQTYVQRGADALKALGFAPETHFVEGEDHFLLFSRPEQVCRITAEWLASTQVLN